MNESIGVKGGYNDRRRTIINEENAKKKLEDEEEEKQIRELEKEVKKQQKISLIRTLPIAVVGGTIKTMYEVHYGRGIDKEEEYSKWRIKEYGADASSRPINVGIESDKRDDLPKRREVIVNPQTGAKVVVYVPVTEEKGKEKTLLEDLVEPIVTAIEDVFVPDKKEEDLVEVDDFIQIYTNGNQIYDKDFQILSGASKETLDKLKSHKIVEVYEEKLKDLRYELRNVIYEYNVLVEEEKGAVLSKDAELIIDKLNDVLDRLERLKAMLKVEDLDKYDDNYIYTLIEGYLSEFKDKRFVSEIKDSPLYVMISDKLDEIDTKKDKFSKKVSLKKDALAEKEIDFEALKSKFYSVDKLNKELLEFQEEQERVLKEVEEKVNNAIDVSERVEVQFAAMSRQSRRLMRMLTLQMLLPGPRFARGAAAGTAAYLHFMRGIVNPQTVTRRYKVITVTDYSDEITNSVRMIDRASDTLTRTSYEVDKMISQIKGQFADYIGVIPECDEVLANLNKIKRDLEEKEYEMKKIKEQQLLVLEKNNAKVKKRGEYPM